MKITRTSPISGITRTKDIPVTQAQMDEWNGPVKKHVQHIFANLSADDREFIFSGITAEEWDELFGPEVNQ